MEIRDSIKIEDLALIKSFQYIYFGKSGCVVVGTYGKLVFVLGLDIGVEATMAIDVNGISVDFDR